MCAQSRRPHSTVRFRRGQKVTVATGKFAGAPGTVVAINLGEVGLSFTNINKVDAWFRPDELTRGRR